MPVVACAQVARQPACQICGIVLKGSRELSFVETCSHLGQSAGLVSAFASARFLVDVSCSNGQYATW